MGKKSRGQTLAHELNTKKGVGEREREEEHTFYFVIIDPSSNTIVRPSIKRLNLDQTTIRNPTILKLLSKVESRRKKLKSLGNRTIRRKGLNFVNV
jgi:hypothetical protein